MDFPLLDYLLKFVLRGPADFHPYDMRLTDVRTNDSIASLLGQLKEYFDSELERAE